MTLGGYLLWFALALQILTLVAYLTDRKEWSRIGYLTTTLFVTVPSILLFYHFLTRDFRLAYVTAYSSSDLPFIYTISSFWAGQEGSFLLWALMACGVGLFLFSIEWEWQRPVMVFYNSILVALLVLLVKQNPFRLLPNPPLDGGGLNPLLQNPWMAIHPPIMFLGYAAFGLPFAFIMAAMWKRDITHWAEVSYKWLVFAWLSLGVGIILGGYWAYETLGWGGYWGWDPVENASLVPWLFGTALLHGIVIQRRYRGFYKTNAVLAIFSFLFIIYGTFLTRSGILGDFSVHSFVDLGITAWLVLFLAIFLLGSMVLFFARIRIFPEGVRVKGLLSPMALLGASLVLLVMSGILIILGTSSPLITRLPFFSNPSQVGIPFYVNTQVPVYLFLLLIFTFFAWKKKIAIPVSLLTLLVVVLSYVFGVHNPVHLLLVAVSISTIAAQLMNPARWSVGLIHAGIGLFILGSVYATGYDELTKVSLVQNQPRQVGDYTFTFKDFTTPPGKRHSAVILDVSRGGSTYTAMPELWFNQKTEQIVANPYIKVGLLRDEYYASHEYTPPEDSSLIILSKGEAREIGGSSLTFLGFKLNEQHQMGEGMVVQALFSVNGRNDPPLVLEYRMVPGKAPETPEIHIPGSDVRARLQRIEATSGSVILATSDSAGIQTGGKTVIEFTRVPFISLVWLGTLMMIVGGVVGLLPGKRKSNEPSGLSESES
ncbi:MAG TPA: cytochrome c biogenesis protein CcsA [Thermoanaerobaculia bacterium]|nr:cytochrome c biogenesis protein CcsA [Thermoanaerobaculia bacterium]HUM29464.1 cytochrome c biogenesis protein CcsA [Thermoanaerobaculia bacterium]HXK67847.1 cytochrome c biogenesis protein CcsA [Thermoanaerobaculia bacterium]